MQPSVTRLTKCGFTLTHTHARSLLGMSVCPKSWGTSILVLAQSVLGPKSSADPLKGRPFWGLATAFGVSFVFQRHLSPTTPRIERGSGNILKLQTRKSHRKHRKIWPEIYHWVVGTSEESYRDVAPFESPTSISSHLTSNQGRRTIQIPLIVLSFFLIIWVLPSLPIHLTKKSKKAGCIWTALEGYWANASLSQIAVHLT